MLELKDASLTLGGRELFRKLSLMALDGQVTCITGEPGTGKTATLQAMLGFLLLDEGLVSIDGELLTPQSAPTFRKLMAYVPQKEEVAISPVDVDTHGLEAVWAPYRVRRYQLTAIDEHLDVAPMATKPIIIADDPALRYHGLEEFDAVMVHFLKKEKLLKGAPELLVADEEKKILIFRRENCIFALNFNPQGSFADYGFSAPEGEFEGVFNSDEPRFGGFGRLAPGEHHTALPQRSPNGNQSYDHTLYLYLPSRCAIVLKKL